MVALTVYKVYLVIADQLLSSNRIHICDPFLSFEPKATEIPVFLLTTIPYSINTKLIVFVVDFLIETIHGPLPIVVSSFIFNEDVVLSATIKQLSELARDFPVRQYLRLRREVFRIRVHPLSILFSRFL